MSIPGSPTHPITIAGKDGFPYVRNIPAWHSGVNGLIIHHIAEEPKTFTTTHLKSGLRIGRSRFASVKNACSAIDECNGGLVDFEQDVQSLIRDIKFTLFIEKFNRISVQVPMNIDGVKFIDIVAHMNENGAASAINVIEKEGKRKK